jgi:tetratricopeptide (TPR) repeat protein
MTPTDEKQTSVLPGAASAEAITTADSPRSEAISVAPIQARAPDRAADRPAPGIGPGSWTVQWMLLVLVAVLGFLLASFPAKDPNLWAHLAQGRDLTLKSLFGSESRPSPYWLFDFVCYQLYGVIGGTGLVVVKALLIGLLAAVLVRLAAIGRAWWIPIFCTSLAMLTVGIRLRLQPMMVSYVFLGLTLWWSRPREKEADCFLPRWPLLVLFSFWANVDTWFIAGPVIFALIQVGRILDGRSSIKALAGVAAAIAVCLLNPAGVNAMRLPPELAWIVGNGTRMTWQNYFDVQVITPAALAYFPLAGLGLLSFALNLPNIRWERLLPWLALAAVSALDVQAVPFFAVVAGPVLAWNMIDAMERWSGLRSVRDMIIWGRAFTVLAVLALVVCAWPGWLQFPPYEPRTWGLETSPSLEGGARVMKQWLAEGKLKPDSAGLHLHQQSVDAFAWFCPEENAVRDERLARVVRGIQDTPKDWAREMRDRKINHVVVYDPDSGRLFAAMGHLLDDPKQWPLLFIEGSMAVFGWRDPAHPTKDPYAGHELDADKLAFATPTRIVSAPPTAETEVEGREWFEAFWVPSPLRTVDKEEATLRLMHAEAVRRDAPRRHDIAWERVQAASLIGAGARWAGPHDTLDAYMRLTYLKAQMPADPSEFRSMPGSEMLAMAYKQQYVLQQDDIPPSMIFLAIRAARRAIAADPKNAQPYLVLGESYLKLMQNTRERVWVQQYPELLLLRQAQASAALNKAVLLKPDFAKAHYDLSMFYRAIRYIDLALEHHRRFYELLRKEGPAAGVSPKDHRERLADVEYEIQNLSKEVEAAQARFELATARAPVADKAEYLTRQLLPGQALKLLMDSNIADFGTRGMRLEIELLLRTGQPEKVRDWVGPEFQIESLGTSYFFEKIQAYAAIGDYAAARRSCEDIERTLAVGPNPRDPMDFRELMSRMISMRVLSELAETSSIVNLSLQAYDRTEFLNRIAAMTREMKKKADVIVLNGLIALEEGDVKEAEFAFRKAMSNWKDAQTAASGGGLDFNGRMTAQGYLDWMK